MSTTAPGSADGTLALASDEDGRSPWRRRGILAVAVLALVGVVVVIAVGGLFGGGSSPPGRLSDNSYSTSSTTVTEQALSAQTQVSGTLGYAGDSTIRLPAGNAPAAVAQAQQVVAAAELALTAAQSSLSSDGATLP